MGAHSTCSTAWSSGFSRLTPGFGRFHFRLSPVSLAALARSCARLKPGLHRGRFADANRSSLDDLAENARPPVRLERGAHRLHQLARRVLAADVHHAAAEAQRLAARVFEVDAADHDVRPAMRRIDLAAELRDGIAPRFLADDRDLPPSALIGASLDAAPLD